MDLMKLLKSLEELLYEIVLWLVFYPITFWRSAASPLQMIRYADEQLAGSPDDQYDDALSPPLFLLLTLLIAQAISVAIPSTYDASTLPPLLSSTANLLIARGVIFSSFPLVMAVTLARRKSIRLTRETLRPQFYGQCYVAAPFVLTGGIALDLMMIPHETGVIWGVAFFAASVMWYGQALVRWFKFDLNVGTATGIYLFITRFIFAIFVILLVTVAIGETLESWSS